MRNVFTPFLGLNGLPVVAIFAKIGAIHSREIMAGIIEIGSALLSRTQAQTELAAQNMVNATTAGYKSRRLAFDALLAIPGQVLAPDDYTQAVDLTPSKLRVTNNPLDLAILGDGFFTVRSGDHLYFTRNGQFGRDADGRVVTAQGYVLQSDSGDVVITSPNPTVSRDGVVLDAGEPVARISVARFEDSSALRPVGGGLFDADTASTNAAASPLLQQGAFETSNVSSGSEMLALMVSLRQAETGQKLIQVYDDLMGRVLTAYSQT